MSRLNFLIPGILGGSSRANKAEMRSRLVEIRARIGVSDPDRIAGQLLVLINGAYAIGQMDAKTTATVGGRDESEDRPIDLQD
jgi:hypothetical protein